VLLDFTYAVLAIILACYVLVCVCVCFSQSVSADPVCCSCLGGALSVNLTAGARFAHIQAHAMLSHDVGS
jgi:hypothetical protein